MSETRTEAADDNKMKIKVDPEDKLTFPTVAYSDITSSDTLCKDAKPLFGVFGDFVGFGVNFNPINGLFTMSAYFKQVDEVEDSSFKAFARDVNGKGGDQNSGIQRIQRFDRVASEGNKFHLDDEAAEMIAPFMHRAALTNSGEVNWKMAGVITTRAIQNTFSAPITYSVINFIDPVKILREMYGAEADIYVGKDNSGNPITEKREVSYQILVMGSIATAPNPYGAPQQQENPEGPFKLDIRQVDVANVHAAAKEVGLNIQVGPRIIA